MDEVNNAEAEDVDAAAANNSDTQYVSMKKSKKFIKFKDYIIKLPNSMGLIGSKNQNQNLNMNNDIGPFVEPANAHNQSDVEGPGGGNAAQSNQNALDSYYGNSYGSFGLGSQLHPNMKLRDKGYSIYVVDDEHEIHRFDIDTYEWTIISTTKDF